MPYFSVRKARDLISQAPLFDAMPIEKLQPKLVRLRDYFRYTHNTCLYFDQLFEGGYFVSATTESSTGWAPVDPWIPTNLRYALDLAEAAWAKRLQELEEERGRLGEQLSLELG